MHHAVKILLNDLVGCRVIEMLAGPCTVRTDRALSFVG